MIFYIIAILVAIELLVHMIYHWKTGKAGLYDPPFAYLKELWIRIKPRKRKEKALVSTCYYDSFSGTKFYIDDATMSECLATLERAKTVSSKARAEADFSLEDWYEMLEGALDGNS